MKSFSQHLESGLVFVPALGIGRYPVPVNQRPYDDSYFHKYQLMADTPMGHALTKSRIALVERHHGDGMVLDVGIGAGQFVEARPQTWGYDVNPVGVQWLKLRGRWADLYTADAFPALTFWDSLEHIDKPELAVAKARKWVFVSIPIFAGGDAIMASHHYRPNEHIWYFTHDGLLRWFAEQGFTCVESNTIESDLGRVGIGSYAFKRTAV
ncbi:methyltransferase domain-containing protein [Serratia nevei]|uniref:methyltransferase domain-containing protein n=1 Tax=Serratia nevei TaxID=2703794 RepID=UPI003F7EFD31